MHCCTANGARTFYYVWDSIVTRESDEVRVNLLLNRASTWLDVDSYLPVEGKAVLHIKDASKVAVRMPEWCSLDDVQVTVGNRPCRYVTDGRYVKISLLNPGDEVAITFPVPEQDVHRVIGEIPYKLTMRGSDVVAIDPKGVALPLYENRSSGKPVQKTRFIPEIRNIIW